MDAEEDDDAGTSQRQPLSRHNDLTPEVLDRITMLCSHPQLQNYRRDQRGRRGAIYIPVERQQTQAALHDFSGSSYMGEDNSMRRNSFCG